MNIYIYEHQYLDLIKSKRNKLEVNQQISQRKILSTYCLLPANNNIIQHQTYLVLLNADKKAVNIARNIVRNVRRLIVMEARSILCIISFVYLVLTLISTTHT